MNAILLLKTVPAVALACYALTKGLPLRHAKTASTQQASQPLPELIQGKVQDVMDDSSYQYALIDTAKDAVWVRIPSGKVEIGQEVACHPTRFVEHLENAKLRMVLEKVYFVDRIFPRDAGNAALV